MFRYCQRHAHSSRRLIQTEHSFRREDAPHKGLNPLFPERGRSRRRVLGLPAREPRADERNLKNERTLRNADATQEFFRPTKRVTANDENDDGDDGVAITSFTSPPLLPSLLASLKETLGAKARPTPIQGLAIKWIIQKPPPPLQQQGDRKQWGQYLLASETGSGKSIAYLLPMIQSLKTTEASSRSLLQRQDPRRPRRLHNPRGLILAPTHELARQLAGFAKSLVHEAKLRVLCASRANVWDNDDNDGKRGSSSSSRSAAIEKGVVFDGDDGDSAGREGGGVEIAVEQGRRHHPVDVLVGTPMKVLEMVRGRGWDRVGMETSAEKKSREEEEEASESSTAPVAEDAEGVSHKIKYRRGRDFSVSDGRDDDGDDRGRRRRPPPPPELGLANIEWVVVDEADVLFDPDFQATTRLLLSDISSARGHPLPVVPAPELEGIAADAAVPPPLEKKPKSPPSTPRMTYPFNLVLTSATIPASLNRYLEAHHPRSSLLRLASPNLHKLPRTLRVEYVPWSSGGGNQNTNKFADVVRRIKRVWAEDHAFSTAGGNNNNNNNNESVLSKILIFCNKSTKVVQLCSYLEEKGGIRSVPVTSSIEHRGRGSNRHLAGFLKEKGEKKKGRGDDKPPPRVMVTTSLLSRGLDFSPEVSHVFIVDEPRNMVDFLHRAGRAGRAGCPGKVVVFCDGKPGKGHGQDSDSTDIGREVRRGVGRAVNDRIPR